MKTMQTAVWTTKKHRPKKTIGVRILNMETGNDEWRSISIGMVPGQGLEPWTPGSTIQCSNQLSYPGPCRNGRTGFPAWGNFGRKTVVEYPGSFPAASMPGAWMSRTKNDYS